MSQHNHVRVEQSSAAEADTESYRSRTESTTAAWTILVTALLLGVPGGWLLSWIGLEDPAVRSLRLLSVLISLGPIVWLLLHYAQRRTEVRISPSNIQIRQMLPLFDRTVPLNEIAMFTIPSGSDCLVLLWLQPRRVAPGDEPRSPRPRVLQSAPLAEPQACLAAMQRHPRVKNDDWTPERLLRRHRRRAVSRRLQFFLIAPLISFILFLIAVRIVFAFLSV
ncbi:MAG: hypothetical protein GYB66_03180 [Chloroflexi bacterium]|nr:hypothetical protein [Chloroflexota bacterium]